MINDHQPEGMEVKIFLYKIAFRLALFPQLTWWRPCRTRSGTAPPEHLHLKYFNTDADPAVCTFDAPVDVAQLELLVLASTCLKKRKMHGVLPRSHATWPP